MSCEPNVSAYLLPCTAAGTSFIVGWVGPRLACTVWKSAKSPFLFKIKVNSLLQLLQIQNASKYAAI